MAHALEKWERLISSTLLPENIRKLSLAGEHLRSLTEESAAGRDKVRKQMIRHAFTFGSEKAMELFVQQHQAVLIRLLDKVYAYETKKDLPALHKQLYTTVRGHLELLLDFIEHYFSKYFNLEEKVPLSYLIIIRTELCDGLPSLKKRLLQVCSGEKQLAEVVCGYIHRFCSEGYSAYSYRDTLYLKELFQQLSGLKETSKKELVYSPLKDLLLYLNFNSPAFLDEMISAIQRELSSIHGTKAKVTRLAFHQKQVGQMMVKPGFALYSNLPPAKEMLRDFLQRELDYLNSLPSDDAAVPSFSISPEPAAKERVHVSFRAPEIYLLSKAFIDAGGSPTETYKSFLEKTGPGLCNKNQKGFSPESLQKCSDKVDYEARENVKRFLTRMIRNVDSY
jgi:hypothetical protein